MRERHTETEQGAIVFDADLVPEFVDDYFSAEFWAEKGQLEGRASGRGVVFFVASEHGNWALRHYRRGGMMAGILKDRYWFSSADRTRSFREWRFLAELGDLGLPVPAPVAARFEMCGAFYQADLITARIDKARPFNQVLLDEEPRIDRICHDVGRCIRLFHDAKVNHADLNVHNIMVTPDQIYLLDFDKGRFEPAPGAWQEQNLLRLRRSIFKVADAKLAAGRCEAIWRGVKQGYAE